MMTRWNHCGLLIIIIKATTGVTGTGAISMTNNINKHTKALIRMLLLATKSGIVRLLYKWSDNFKNQFGRMITI